MIAAWASRAWAVLTATRRRRILSAVGGGAALLVVTVAVVVAVGGGGDEDRSGPGPGADAEETTSTPRRSTTTTSTTALPAPPPGGLRFLPEDQPDNGSHAPLTGLPVPDPALLSRPAVAVKIDNLDVPGESARPQVGLAQADVVVEEVVEGGITRFAALFHSTEAADVGPVRSARTTDVDLLPAFGAPLFAFSGGNPTVLAQVAAAPRIIDRGGEWPPAYHRVGGGRRAPHNLFVRPPEIWARPGNGQPPAPLATFRARGQGSPIGDPVRGLTVQIGGIASAAVAWLWLPEEGRWLRTQRGTTHLDGGAEGYAVGPRNVLVMITDYVTSAADPRSPQGVSVGSGEMWAFTDGKLVVGRWERPSVDAPFRFVAPDGAPLSLAAGRTWIELVPAGRAEVVR